MLQKDGRFNFESFKNFVRVQLQSTPNAFLEEQKKELLASRVRNLVRSSVAVSPDEVKSDFVRKNRQINLEYLRFTSRRQEAEVALDGRGDRRLRQQERGEAEGDLRAEEVPLREGAAAAAGPADPRQGAPRRRREDRQGGAREGGRAGRKAQARREEHRQGRADLRRAGEAVVRRHRDQGARRRSRLEGAGRGQPRRARPRTRCSPPRTAPSSDRSRAARATSSRRSRARARDTSRSRWRALELAEEKLRQEQAVDARQGGRRGGAGEGQARAPTATLKTIFPPPSDTQEAHATPAPRRASRRPGCSRRARRPKAWSSRASASRTPSRRPPSRSRRTSRWPARSRSATTSSSSVSRNGRNRTSPTSRSASWSSRAKRSWRRASACCPTGRTPPAWRRRRRSASS